MNLLLDTHAFLWWIDDDPLPARAAEAIRNPENSVDYTLVSIDQAFTLYPVKRIWS